MKDGGAAEAAAAVRGHLLTIRSPRGREPMGCGLPAMPADGYFFLALPLAFAFLLEALALRFGAFLAAFSGTS